MLFMGHQIINLHYTKTEIFFINDTNKQDSFLLAYLEKSTLNKCKEKSRSECICRLIWSTHATYQWKHGPRAKSCRHAAINNLMNSRKLSNCYITKHIGCNKETSNQDTELTTTKNEQKLSLGIKIFSHITYES